MRQKMEMFPNGPGDIIFFRDKSILFNIDNTEFRTGVVTLSGKKLEFYGSKLNDQYQYSPAIVIHAKSLEFGLVDMFRTQDLYDCNLRIMDNTTSTQYTITIPDFNYLSILGRLQPKDSMTDGWKLLGAPKDQRNYRLLLPADIELINRLTIATK